MSRPPLDPLIEASSSRPARPGGRPTKRRSAAALGLVPIFVDLSSRHLRRVGDLTEEVPYPAGAKVVEEGLPGEALFVILEGEARVTRQGRSVARLRPGDVFGEISVLDGGRRTATVVARTPLLVLRLYRRDLTKLMQKEPQIAGRLLRELARRLRRSERGERF